MLKRLQQTNAVAIPMRGRASIDTNERVRS